MTKTDTVVVIPAFNESRTIRALCLRVLEQPIARVVVVDDGSTDGTPDTIRDLDLDLLVNPVNQGKGFSLLRGMRHAQGLGCRSVVTLDADGQHLPEDIPRLLAQAERHPQRILIAARLKRRERAPPLRRFANRFADFWISWACAQPVRDSQSGFRLYPIAVLERTETRPRPGAGFAFESEILIDAARQGIGSLSIAIETLYGTTARDSHYRPLRDTWTIVRMVGEKLLQRGLDPIGLWRSLRPLPADTP